LHLFLKILSDKQDEVEWTKVEDGGMIKMNFMNGSRVDYLLLS